MNELSSKFKITKELLDLGHNLFLKIELRDSMYKISTFLINRLKNNLFSEEIWITDAILVLLLTWHSGFFRYGVPNNFHENLRSFIEKNEKMLFKEDDIMINQNDAEKLFNELLEILTIITKKKQKRKSGVAVVKVLHLLNSYNFPLWDNYIAKAYLGSADLKKFNNYWKFKEIVDNQYLWFQKEFEKIKISVFYKILDELNYVFFTQRSLSAESCERLVRLLKEHSSDVRRAKDELEELLDKDKIDENIYLEVLELGICD